MKNYILFIFLFATLLSCKNDPELFEKSADERVIEAIASLKNELTAPANGWLLKYRPDQETGQYLVILKFDQNGKVNIQTDLSVNEGEYFNQTISYRIDNSLGLELIFENYSFFSYLFEQDQANFGAEFEFNYINKTPDNALVFNSKTDRSTPTIIVLIPSAENDINLLGRELDEKFSLFSSSMKLTYEDKDAVFYLSRENLRRNIHFKYISTKADINDGRRLNFTTGYLLQGDSIIFDSPLTTSFKGQDYTVRGIKLDDYSEVPINICPEPTNSPYFSGSIRNSNDKVVMENSLFDIDGAQFYTRSDFFISPTYWVFDQDLRSAESRIIEDIKGASSMQLYYNFELNSGPFYAIGFYIQNPGQGATWALKEFTPVLNENILQFDFADDISIFGNQNTEADIDKINIYLDLLTKDGKTHIIQINQFVYEFYNPCSGWRFYFQAI